MKKYRDLLTGKEIKENTGGLCPRCKTHSVHGDPYHQLGKCLNCGWFNPSDD